MPHFGAIEESKRLADDCYKSMNKKRLLSRQIVRDTFCTESCTEIRAGVTHRIRKNSYILTERRVVPHVGSNGFAMSAFVAYVDGGSLGNPGPSGIGVVMDTPEGAPIRISKWIGHQDNNVAEYVALLEALQCALNLKASALQVYSDSQVVVRQMRGEYECRSPRLYSLHWICRKLARSLEFSIQHVARKENAEANRLANAGARQQNC